MSRTVRDRGAVLVKTLFLSFACFTAWGSCWAVRQPRYTSWCLVTAWLETWRTHPAPQTGGRCWLTHRTVGVSPTTTAAASPLKTTTTTMSTARTVICLLRNDLRLHDNEVRLHFVFNVTSPFSREIWRFLTVQHLLNLQVDVFVYPACGICFDIAIARTFAPRYVCLLLLASS